MATDLSKLIQDGLCSTINGLLSLDTKLEETTKAHPKDLENLNILKIESKFEFNDLISTWQYILPAHTASYIFNKMIADESEPIDTIDEDISDAMGEVASNISGSLVTTINGSEFEDLNNGKFSIVSNTITTGEEFVNIENTFRFLLSLDGKELSLFINFEENMIPFLTEISKSEQTHYEEPAEEKEVEEEEEIVNSDQDNPIKEVTNIPEPQNDETNEENTEDIESTKDEEDQPKKDKLKIIVIIVAALLAITIITGVILYFTGAFDKEIPIVDTNSTNTTKQKGIEIVKYKTEKKTDFKESDIDKKRLNKQLHTLTKYYILNKEEIEIQNQKEKERLSKLHSEEELAKFAAKNKEENIFIDKKEPQIERRTEFTDPAYKKENNSTVVKNEQIDDGKLKFITVKSLKYKLFKEFIKKVNDTKARISICKNKEGRTMIYLGPFNNNDTQNKMKELIQKETKLDLNISNIEQEEFDIRCKF
ncbi:MAG: hypothetical protein U9Q33_07580 [Campylobacterota bacterium]|nr:hypothetical protein [Campylobacterota bacterium]